MVVEPSGNLFDGWVLVAVAQAAEKSLLDDVLGCFLVADKAIDKVVQGGAIAFDQHAEMALVFGGPQQNFPIRECIHRFHGYRSFLVQAPLAEGKAPRFKRLSLWLYVC